MSDRLTAGDVCTRIVTIAYRGTPLSEAARLMRDHHVGCLVVVEETDVGRVVVGMLTDRDIVVSVVARERDASLISIGEAMSTDLVMAREQDSVTDLLELMSRKGVRRIPVTGPQGVLVGLVALDDLLQVVAEEMQTMAAAISSGRKREGTERLGLTA
jgi:CBS domain-containing protein